MFCLENLRSTSLLSLVLFAASATAQVGGNAGYQQYNTANGRAQANEKSERVLANEDIPSDGSMFVDASVLMNIKADAFVAVFAVARDGATVEEAQQKMNATVKQFLDALKPLHVRESDVYVDFVAQPKTYGYEITENTAREKANGFELKKNISVHFTSRDLIDKLMEAAAQCDIYDLVKVDYVVSDVAAMQARLMAEASSVIQAKLTQDEKLLGIKVKPMPEIYLQRPAAYYPTEMYDSSTAAEGDTVTRPAHLERYSVVQARRGRTFYFNPLNASGFDKVVNPVVIEPVVQFTLYLKLRYQLAK